MVSQKSISLDTFQLAGVQALNEIYLQLVETKQNVSHNEQLVTGVYLWGKVGRGKTFLMDLFYESLPNSNKMRSHFHHFMKSVHQQLAALAGQVDPLKVIAKRLSAKYRIICFDEFFVSDIGDAMLLGTLVNCLFEHKVTMVMTSNVAPTDLYKNGLQRARFIPAILAIEQHTNIVSFAGEKDHRHRVLTTSPNYFVQKTVGDIRRLDTQEKLSDSLQHLDKNIRTIIRESVLQEKEQVKTIEILGRQIETLGYHDQVICFEFSALCDGPRSQLDYIDIANRFQSVILLNVPALTGTSYEHIKARGTEDGAEGSGSTGERAVFLSVNDDAVRRLIALVDEFYERKVNLYIFSNTPLASLYTQGSLLFEFERTKSRLVEMGSEEYQSASWLGEQVHV